MNYKVYRDTLNQFVKRLNKDNLLCVLLGGSLLTKKIHKYSDIDILLVIKNKKQSIKIRYVVEEINNIKICQYWFKEEVFLTKLFEEKYDVIIKMVSLAHPVYLNDSFKDTFNLIQKFSQCSLEKLVFHKCQLDQNKILQLLNYLKQNQNINSFEHTIILGELITTTISLYHDLIFNTIEKKARICHIENIAKEDPKFVNLVALFYKFSPRIQNNIIIEIFNLLIIKWK